MRMLSVLWIAGLAGVAALTGVFGGCATSPSHAPEPIAALSPAVGDTAPRADLSAIARSIAAMLTPDLAPAASPYASHVRSVRFVATTVLRKQPAITADKIGVIARDARARPAQAAPAGHGCARRWIEIEPRGWACETVLAPSRDEPTAARTVALADDDADDDAPVVRGVYGAVRGRDVAAFTTRADALAGQNARVLTGSTSVRARGVVRVDGRRYWVTTGGQLIDAAAIATISPSRFRGVALDDATTLPIAWVHGKRKRRAPIALRDAPAADAAIIGQLAPRTVVAIAETSADDRFIRIAHGRIAEGWVARADLRIAALAAPPAGTASDERWFDIDLDEQVLVAYEGTRPVYATLVSTGKRKHRTPTSITRVASKLETATMTSEKRELYSVADVPWTMYYDHNFALHTSYWHDGFGDPRSHGCINLAPRDARALYHWSSPDVPPGWTAVYGDADNPGSLIRVRSRAEPEPALRGYARTMQAPVETAVLEHRSSTRRDADPSMLRR
jgi:lipoprotein-anchoring transpeptidase ErfK/SrfK